MSLHDHMTPRERARVERIEQMRAKLKGQSDKLWREYRLIYDRARKRMKASAPSPDQ